MRLQVNVILTLMKNSCWLYKIKFLDERERGKLVYTLKLRNVAVISHRGNNFLSKYWQSSLNFYFNKILYFTRFNKYYVSPFFILLFSFANICGSQMQIFHKDVSCTLNFSTNLPSLTALILLMPQTGSVWPSFHLSSAPHKA